MNTQDNYPVASKISEGTIKLLTHYQIPPTPINFSVIYHYLTKRNSEMNQKIDEQISWQNSLDAVFLEAIFIEFFSSSDKIEKSLLVPFEVTLSSTMDKLKQQVANDEEIAKSFKKVDQALTKASENNSLQPIVEFITNNLTTSTQQRNKLNEELNKTYQQVSQLKAQLKESKEEAIKDALTGLYNRRGCDEKLQELDDESIHSSLAIDIDHFKKVNDTFGHAVGDKVIQCVASTINQHISHSDFAVRFGGEEFLVILANKEESEAKNIAEKIRIAITQLKLKQKKSNTYLPPISISIGIAEHHNNTSWKSVFENADAALYQAKESGRNCCISA